MEKINVVIYKVAIVGPEASGKTALAIELASHFNEPWVPEFARPYLEAKNGIYIQSDLDIIATKQLNSELILEKKAKQFLFCDTNPLVVKIWSDYKYGNVSKQILKSIDNSSYDLHLLLKPDLTYEDDPLRENPNIDDRNELYQIYYKELTESQVKFATVDGHGKTRLKNAISVLQEYFY